MHSEKNEKRFNRSNAATAAERQSINISIHNTQKPIDVIKMKKKEN